MALMPVHPPVLNGFGDMLFTDFIRIRQIRDGARDFQNAVIRAGGQVQAGDGLFEQVFAVRIRRAEPVDFLDAQLIVGFSLPVDLLPVGFFDTPPDGCAFLAGCLLAHQFFLRHGGHFDLQVDAIEQRAGNPRAVAGDLIRRAMAFAGSVSQVTAGT